jgi:hypothetical protein
LKQFNTDDLSKPYFLSIVEKMELQNLIYKIIGKNHYQCFNKSQGEKNNLINKIQVEKYLSKGSFGRVFIGCFPISVKTLTGAKCAENSIRIAVKTTEISPNEMNIMINKPININRHDWREVGIMKYLVNPLLNHGYTSNLPFLYNWYICPDCSPLYTRKIGNVNSGCIMLLTELAKGDMYDMFIKYMMDLVHNVNLNLSYGGFDSSATFLLCSLFQIMNGLNAMQQYSQITHSDIKSQNMLVHRIKVKPNQYIHYNVNGEDYWLPNIGISAMISDFGLCQTVHPFIPNIFSYTGKPIENKITRRDLGARPGLIMGPPGKEKFTLFDLQYSDIGNLGSHNGVLLKNWNGASDNFAIMKNYPSLYKKYGMSVLNIHKNKLSGHFEYIPVASDPIILQNNKLIDMNIIVKDKQKKYLESLNISSNPKTLEFYNHVQQIPALDMMNDTQDVLRTFAGGQRSVFSHPHMSATWALGPYLTSNSIEVLQEVAKYTTIGPFSDVIDIDSIQNVFPETWPGCTILSDNPAHLLASYFIRDFKYFNIFKKRPPLSSEILGSFKQPNGPGNIFRQTL